MNTVSAAPAGFQQYQQSATWIDGDHNTSVTIKVLCIVNYLLLTQTSRILTVTDDYLVKQSSLFKMEATDKPAPQVTLPNPVPDPICLNRNQNLSTPVTKRKIDDIKSPVDTITALNSSINGSIIFTQTTQESPDRKFRLVEGEDPSSLEEGNPNTTSRIKVGNKGKGNKLVGGAKIPHQQSVPKRGAKRVQPARLKKSFKAKRIPILEKKSKSGSPKPSKPTFPPQVLPTSKDNNPVTRSDLEECLESVFSKFKLEFPSRVEITETLELHKFKLLNEISSVHELVQSNAISINNQQVEGARTKEGLEILKHVVEQSEEERKSDYQFLSNKLNKLTANVANVKKVAEWPNTAMMSVKLNETNLKIDSEIKLLQDKYVTSQEELVKLCKEVETLKTKFEKMKVNEPDPSAPSKAPLTVKSGSSPVQPSDYSKCIIIEGVSETLEVNLYDIVVDIMDELNITLHYWEINHAERIGRFSPNRNWPRPIRLSLVSDWKRDYLLDSSDKLFFTENYYRVSFKPDEPKDVRVAKAKLRQAVNKAKRQGVTVRQTDNGVYLNGIKYSIANVDELPERFAENRKGCVLSFKEISEHPLACSMQLKPINFNAETAVVDMEVDTAKSVREWEIGEWLEPGIRKIEKGLAFFTYQAYMSNFNETPFTLDNEDHKTGEHGLQMEKAWFHRDLDAVMAIRSASTPAEAKAAGRAIQSSPEWNIHKYSAADKVSYARYSQNLDLAERLCATGNATLVEGSTDTDWGIGISIWDAAITKAEGPGNNNFGKSTERVRSRLQREKREKKGPWAIQ